MFSLPIYSPPLPGPLPRKFWAIVASALVPESHSWEVWPGGAHKSMVGTQERSPSGTLTGSCFSTALSNLAKEHASRKHLGFLICKLRRLVSMVSELAPSSDVQRFIACLCRCSPLQGGPWTILFHSHDNSAELTGQFIFLPFYSLGKQGLAMARHPRSFGWHWTLGRCLQIQRLPRDSLGTRASLVDKRDRIFLTEGRRQSSTQELKWGVP